MAVTTLLHLKTGKELMWPFSNPPYVLGEKDIPIASYEGVLRGKELYREYLAGKYGKRKMLFSGIHFNFSFSEKILEEGYRNSTFVSLQEYKNQIYLELAKKVTRCSWLIVYLTAASPVMDGSFFHDEDLGKVVLKNLASPRCSKIGYWNDFDPLLDYENLQSYVKSIESYVAQGQLKEAAELYYPVRLKPKGENTLERLKNYAEDGIWIETGWNSAMPVKQAALHVLASMKRFFQRIGKQELMEIIYFQEQKIFCPNNRYAVQIKSMFEKDYVKREIELAEQHARVLTDMK